MARAPTAIRWTGGITSRVTQAAEKLGLSLSLEGYGLYMLRKNSNLSGFVTGHDFSRAGKANKMSLGLYPLLRPM
jgi:hypothetical protein